MHKGRVEAFSDGVIAIIITIMVLELKTPAGTTMADLLDRRSIAFCYVLSFLYLAIYWTNHHHLLQSIQHVNGAILWANNYLLFWLSLIPFVTAWAGEHDFASLPTALYGFVLFMAAIAYYILERVLIAHEGKSSTLANAIGRDFKGKISVIFYGFAVPLAFYAPLVSVGIYAIMAIAWIVPDKRIERQFHQPS